MIVENAAALRLYEKLGYEHVRDLEVWTLGEIVAESNYLLPARATVAEANAWIRAHRAEREPASESAYKELFERAAAPGGSLSLMNLPAGDAAGAALAWLRSRVDVR